MWPNTSVDQDRMANAVAGLELALALIGACEGTCGGHAVSDAGELRALVGTVMAGYGGHADSAIGDLPPHAESALVQLMMQLDRILNREMQMPGDLWLSACARLRRVAASIAAGEARRSGELGEGPYLLVAMDLSEIAAILRRLDPPFGGFDLEALDLLSHGPLDLAGQLCSAAVSRL